MEFFNKLPVFRSITKLTTIHLFIHICFKHLHYNPSPTIPETFSVWLISLPAVDGSRQTDLKGREKQKQNKTMVTGWKMHFRKGSLQSSGSVILGFFFQG